MTWTYTLKFTCKILPEFIELFDKEYSTFSEKCSSYNIWNGYYTSEFNINESIFHCTITNPIEEHPYTLCDNYISFVKDIIVQYSSTIYFCHIESNDSSYDTRYYTDSELRDIVFSLHDNIGSIQHIYDDNGDITRTIVNYNKPIKRISEIDLDKCYGFNL